MQRADQTTDNQGSVAYTYVQHGSKIALHRYTAHVRVTVQKGTQSRSFRRIYQIAFGRIDVSVALPQARGDVVRAGRGAPRHPVAVLG